MFNRQSFNKHLTFVMLLIFAFQTIPIGVCLSEKDDLNIERLDYLPLIERDVLAIYISPTVENLSVRCQPLYGSGDFDLSISTNYVNPDLKKSSVIWVRLYKPGSYNLTINFFSNRSWEYMVGVYARNYNFYKENYGEKRISPPDSFLRLEPIRTRSAGRWMISSTLVVQGTSPSSYRLVLPTPVNLAMLISVIGLIAYVNGFVFLDTYFKSKKEIVSNTRWIMVLVVLLISAYVAYQVYVFTQSTLSVGG